MPKKKITKKKQLINGIDVEKLTNTIKNIEDNPDLAQFQFRAYTEWVDGAYNSATVQSFCGLGEEDTTREESFIIETDEPDMLLGSNKAPNAVELILAVLASCLHTGFIYNAAARGIKIESLTTTIQGNIDIRGFLGLSEEIRPGYQNINVAFNIDSDASKEQLDELCKHVQKTSPILDMITKGQVPVTIKID